MQILWKLASRSFPIGVIALVLCLCAGCAGANTQCTLNPLTGAITCGVSVPPSAVPTDTPIIAGATRSIFRARGIDDCADGSRAISPAFSTSDRSAQIQTFGRGVYPAILAARGLTSVSLRQLSRSQKAVHQDLKREAHNAKVIRDYTDQRSMWSWFEGRVFLYHDKLDPLDPALQVAYPAIETVQNPPAQIIEPAAGPGPAPVQTGADGSFLIEAKKSVSNLEMRVGSLEYEMKEQRGATIQQARRIDGISEDIGKLNAAIGAQSKDIKDILAALATKK